MRVQSDRTVLQVRYERLGSKSKGAGVESEPRDYQDVIDQALQLVYSHHHRLITRLYPQAFQPLSIEQLRNGPLGQDLHRLSLLARGQIREPKERVLTAIDAVVQLLFWPAAADDYTVPRSFWDTELGRVMAMAKFRAYEPSELVSIGTAAQQLGVTRPTIYRWMDDRTLNYVRDDMSGRTFVVRRDIEFRKRVEMDLHEQQ
jgi:excisionase family DNA binding protein